MPSRRSTGGPFLAVRSITILRGMAERILVSEESWVANRVSERVHLRASFPAMAPPFLTRPSGGRICTAPSGFNCSIRLPICRPAVR